MYHPARQPGAAFENMSLHSVFENKMSINEIVDTVGNFSYSALRRTLINKHIKQ